MEVPQAGEYIVEGAYITRVVGQYEDGWIVETDRPMEAIPGDGVVIYHNSIFNSISDWTTRRLHH